MQDSATPLRLEKTATLSGANWVAPRSVVIATVRGGYSPAVWPTVHSLLARLFPAGLPADPFPHSPESAAGAVEALACYLLSWMGNPPPAVARTAAGRQARHLAAIPLGSAEMILTAIRLAKMILDGAGSPNAPDAEWMERTRGNLLNTRHTAANWLPRSRGSIVRAAQARDIPWRTLAAAPHTVQLGEGRYARRFESTASWRTSTVSVSLASDKRHGNQMLRRGGLPVARQRPVASADAARAAAAHLGLPMVLKPTGLRFGQGMRIVYREADIDDAWAVSSAFGHPVVAESYIPGNEYRVLVVDGAVIAAIARIPATVTGDGRATIAELVERENRNPGRGQEEDGFLLMPIRIHALAERYLEREGLSYASVPAPGQVVQVHPLPMVKYGGGGRQDVTDRVHPDNRAMAVRAVSVFGLDIAGIDLRMPDITRSWREVGAGICEVNPQPNLGIHYGAGSPMDVGGLLLDRCYPAADRGPMRHVLLLGDGDLDAHVAATAAALRARFGWRVGTVSRSGIDLDGWRPGTGARSLPEAYGVIVEDTSLDAAVYAVPPEAAIATGLGMERVDVALMAAAAATPEAERVRQLATAIIRGMGRSPQPMPETPDAAAGVVTAALQRIVAAG